MTPVATSHGTAASYRLDDSILTFTSMGLEMMALVRDRVEERR